MAHYINWGAPETLEPDAIDGHKSFHGKAYTRQGSALTPERDYVTVRELYSYGTKVAAIYLDPDDGPTIIIGRPYLFSATTGRHSVASLGGTPTVSPTASRIFARRGRTAPTY